MDCSSICEGEPYFLCRNLCIDRRFDFSLQWLDLERKSWATLAVLVEEEAGHGRGARTAERETTSHQQVESEPCTSMQQSSKDVPNDSMAIDNGPESKENIAVHEESTQSLRDIDLNCNLYEDKDNTSIATQASLPANLLQQRYSMKKFQVGLFLMWTKWPLTLYNLQILVVD